MVTTTWVIPALCTIGLTVTASFWGWLAVKVIDQGRKLVELEGRIISQEVASVERLEWLRILDEKLDTVSENTAKICGKLEINT